jgi:hypothetical protein
VLAGSVDSQGGQQTGRGDPVAMQDYHEALMRLERSAGELRGEARVAALRRWVAVSMLLDSCCASTVAECVYIPDLHCCAGACSA